MKIGLLAEQLYVSDRACYLGAATPQCWDSLKKELEGLNIEYFAAELRPEDGTSEWLVLASAPFKSGDVPEVGKKIKLGKSAKKLSGQEAAGWIMSMMRTARAERFRIVISGVWGLLVINDNEERNSE